MSQSNWTRAHDAHIARECEGRKVDSWKDDNHVHSAREDE